MKLTTEEYVALKRKADKWDELGKKIAKFYPDEETKEVGDLCDIGEVAAAAFGWL